MANWSDTTIELSGIQAADAIKYIESLIKNNYLSFITSKEGYSSMEVHEIHKYLGLFTIYGSGRWSAPYAFFSDIAAKYNLSGYFLDREAGNDYTHVIVFESGAIVKEETADYFSQLAFDYWDIEGLIEDRAFIFEEEDYESIYADDIALFAANGITLEDLKSKLGVK